MSEEKELEKRKCYLCDKEVLVLVKVETAMECGFFSSIGICTECFKHTSLDNKILAKARKVIEENIEASTQRTNYWINELKKLKND